MVFKTKDRFTCTYTKTEHVSVLAGEPPRGCNGVSQQLPLETGYKKWNGDILLNEPTKEPTATLFSGKCTERNGVIYPEVLPPQGHVDP